MFVFNFGVGSLKQSVKLGWFIVFDFLGNSPLKTPLYPNWQPKSSAFYSVFVVWAVFQPQWWKKTYLNVGHCFACKFSNFVATSKACIWLAVWVSLIIDQSECLICYFLCTELTLFCTELSENCIYLNQSELSNFFMYIIKTELSSPILSNLFHFHQNMICTFKCIELKTPCVRFVLSHFLIFQSFFFFKFKVALLNKVISGDALSQKLTKKT